MRRQVFDRDIEHSAAAAKIDRLRGTRGAIERCILRTALQASNAMSFGFF
jgi:hypothetical protein